MELVKEKEFYCWVAPDGTIQPSTLAESRVMVIAFTKLLHKAKIGMSYSQLEFKGFKIMKVLISVTPID